MPTDPYALFSYSAKTDRRVGVACADDRTHFDYNCAVTWHDRGIPDGNVLYKYFRVNGSAIEWRTNSWKRSGANTEGGVAAAFFDGKLWMAWRDPDHDIAYTSNEISNGSYSGWSTAQTQGRSGVVDAPTWSYVSHENREAALTWTEE